MTLMTPEARTSRPASVNVAHAVAAPGIDGPVLITGGAGFIGTNLAARLLGEGREVIVYDNLSRPGVAENLRWLSHIGNGRMSTCLDDTRDAEALRNAVRRAACVYHFAAQVAVNSSIEDPVTDFEINLRGTLNVLEAIRRSPRRPPLVFTSSNKVYGALPDVALSTATGRYQPEDPEIRLFGISESRPLDFCSPHGCSKGAADQYILDYARSFGIAAVVLRMGGIYGPHQCANEDQGWVAHFLLQAIRGQPITIHGDGMQVRDILYVDDLVEALLSCGENRDALRGRAFNLGGGTANTVSPAELVELIRGLRGRAPHVVHAGWRAGDPRYFVADTRRFGSATGWRPRVAAAQGIGNLLGWFSRTSDESSTASACVA